MSPQEQASAGLAELLCVEKKAFKTIPISSPTPFPSYTLNKQEQNKRGGKGPLRESFRPSYLSPDRPAVVERDLLTLGQQKRWLLAEGKWEVVAVTPESLFLEAVTHQQVVGTKLLSGAELVACALGHMPSKLASTAALSHAGSRWCSCPGSEQTSPPQVPECEQLNCAHFLHACLEYVVEAQKSPWPMKDVEHVFPKLSCSPSGPQ